jgi:hypothetical protein
MPALAFLWAITIGTRHNLVVVLQLHAGREAWPSWVLAAHLAALSLARAPGLCTRATPGQEAQPVTEPVS